MRHQIQREIIRRNRQDRPDRKLRNARRAAIQVLGAVAVGILEADIPQRQVDHVHVARSQPAQGGDGARLVRACLGLRRVGEYYF